MSGKHTMCLTDAVTITITPLQELVKMISDTVGQEDPRILPLDQIVLDTSRRLDALATAVDNEAEIAVHFANDRRSLHHGDCAGVSVRLR